MAQPIALQWPRPQSRGFEPDERQRAVIEHSSGHLRVLAGPGTGKTSVIVAAVHERLRAGQPAESMLVLTYGRMAAAELRRRLTVGEQPVPIATTFHALAYRLLQAQDPAINLMNAPRQEAVLRALIEQTEHLPAELEAARRSRGLAEHLRSFISRAQSAGIDPASGTSGDALRIAAEAVYAEYLDVVALSGGLDYATLITTVTRTIEREPPAVVRQLRTIYVDEYQDTDPAQVALLRAITAHGAQVVAVGDPDQSIYGFRGADATGILQFDEVFPLPSCRTIALGATRRFGPQIAQVARRTVPRNALGTVPAEQVLAHRNPQPLGAEGQVSVRLYESEPAAAEHIADLLRRVHAGSSSVFPGLRLEWSQMAVLVRSARRDIPALARALVAAGIPVEVAGDDIPLAASPPVRPLLDVLRVAAGVDGGLTPERAAALLESPLAGLDARGVTAVARRLRRRATADADGPPPPSSELLVAALRQPETAAGLDPEQLRAVTTLATILDTATLRVTEGRSASQILNEVWHATEWPRRLRTEALGGGRRARAANIAIDAVMELFSQAEQSDRAYESVRTVAGFLQQIDEQVIPGAPDQQREWNREAVRLLTAHRSKGSQWPLVVVAGVQEGAWPDVRRRLSIFEDDIAGHSGWRDEQLLEERRLFFVACTRASQALLVSAVSSSSDDGAKPSAFVSLAVGDREPVMVSGRPLRPLTPIGVVAHLRQQLLDPDTSPAYKRAVWERLALLADTVDEQGRPIYPWAATDRWWGHREWTENSTAWFDPDEPLRLSASAIEQYVQCPRKWFLEKRVGAADASSTSMAFGNVLHLCAQALADGELEPDEARISEVLDTVWHAVGYEPGWQQRYEREQAQAATGRLLAWLRNAPGDLVAAEKEFDVQLTLDGDEVVNVRGTADRVDRVGEELLITDYKTGKSVPTRQDVAEHVQLGLYRWVAELGGLGEPGRALAQLLYLRADPPAKQPEMGAKLLLQDRPDVPVWLGPIIASVAAGMRAQSAPARPGPACGNCRLSTSCPARPAGSEVRP